MLGENEVLDPKASSLPTLTVSLFSLSSTVSNISCEGSLVVGERILEVTDIVMMEPMNRM